MALTSKKIVALVGGVGGAKLAHGLAQIVPPENLTIIVNTGDDFWHYGLRICPDLDTVMYTLGGIVDRVNGWGIAGDTTIMLDALRRFGEATWFRLGDQDIATHLLRTDVLHTGKSLTEITSRLTKNLGISQRILPMTDGTIATMIETVEYGELEFQTYFVRYRWQPTVRNVRFAGSEVAQASPQVIEALETADVILIAPSNPWLSIAPIFATTPIRELILSLDIPRVAVSPIVAGQAIKGPAAKLMDELGLEVSPHAVAEYYGGVINGFVYDQRDSEVVVNVPHTALFDTIMKTETDRATLAAQVLTWIEAEDWS